jgi:GAF domain-containing protein
MTENEVLFQISAIVNGRASFPQAVQQIANFLEREAHGKGIFADKLTELSEVVDLLESFGLPYRSLYTVALRDGGESLGNITLCFASDHFEGTFQQRLADFVGAQLGMLLARTRLRERRAELLDEISRIEDDLASRKVMQRAEGILIAGGMAPPVARRWIGQQSQRTGLSKNDVADRIIAYYQATGLLEQRIA